MSPQEARALAMSDNKVVDFPKSAVKRPPPPPAELSNVAIRLDPNVQVCRLMRGLASVGMTFRHDPVGGFVIMPLAMALRMDSEEE